MADKPDEREEGRRSEPRAKRGRWIRNNELPEGRIRAEVQALGPKAAAAYAAQKERARKKADTSPDDSNDVEAGE